MNSYNLTKGSIIKNLLIFSLPYLFSCFFQTFYGLADLFIAGHYNGPSTITAISNGSQITHMLTVLLVGLAMGSTVSISRSVGAKNHAHTEKIIGNSIVLFSLVACFFTILFLFSRYSILSTLHIPPEAFSETMDYITICFWGIPFITAYNTISSIYRGLGDSKHPMYFVVISGIINIILDYLFIGILHRGASGAALATIIAQGISVILALLYMPKAMNLRFTKKAFCLDKLILKQILRIGIPISAQDGFIQISFLIITRIANQRGVEIAAAVGIVEKIIGFLFLVSSAMLSAVSTICAQNLGAGKEKRSRTTLFTAMGISVGFGILSTMICLFFGKELIQLFSKEDTSVIHYGVQYLNSYVFDCIFAGIHFCFSGYFCALEKPIISFFHNVCSIILVRIPFAYYASILWPQSLLPMGIASPAGSIFSSIICLIAYFILSPKKEHPFP